MNETVECIETCDYTVEIIRANRVRTVGIRVYAGKISIRVPHTFSLLQIKDLIERKKRWINKKLKLQKITTPTLAKKYIDGELFSYFGESYILKIRYAEVIAVELSDKTLNLTLPKILDTPMFRKNAIVGWYMRQAKHYLVKQVKRYETIIGKKPKQIKIRLCKSRWGSCSNMGNINFNWLIIMAPKSIIDYVVVHELCHLIEHNHSPVFWQLVEKAMPSYLSCREWLKQNANCFVI